MKLVDLKNKRFGKLTVSGRSPKGGKAVYWNCLCDCGASKEINGDALKKGSTKSCGCLKGEKGSWNRGVYGPKSHSFQGFGKIPKSYFSDIKYRAAVRGIGFHVTIEYLWEIFLSQNGLCALSGLPLGFYESGEIPQNIASLDRIDSSLDYAVGNVQWVDRRVNVLKSNMSDKELIWICSKIAEYHERNT